MKNGMKRSNNKWLYLSDVQKESGNMKYIVEYDIPKEVGEPSKTHNTPFLSPSNAVYLLFFFFSVNSQLCFFKMLSFYLLAIRYISTSPL